MSQQELGLKVPQKVVLFENPIIQSKAKKLLIGFSATTFALAAITACSVSDNPLSLPDKSARGDNKTIPLGAELFGPPKIDSSQKSPTVLSNPPFSVNEVKQTTSVLSEGSKPKNEEKVEQVQFVSQNYPYKLKRPSNWALDRDYLGYDLFLNNKHPEEFRNMHTAGVRITGGGEIKSWIDLQTLAQQRIDQLKQEAQNVKSNKIKLDGTDAFEIRYFYPDGNYAGEVGNFQAIVKGRRSLSVVEIIVVKDKKSVWHIQFVSDSKIVQEEEKVFNEIKNSFKFLSTN